MVDYTLVQLSECLSEKYVDVSKNNLSKTEFFNGMFHALKGNENLSIELLFYAIEKHYKNISAKNLGPFCVNEVKKWTALKLQTINDVVNFYQYSADKNKKITIPKEQNEAERLWLIENITIPCREDKEFWSLEELRRIYKAQEEWKKVKQSIGLK